MQDIQQPRAHNVTSIVGLVVAFVPVPLVSGIVAMVLGVVGLRQIERDGQKGQPIAILAIVFGALSVVCWGIPFAFFGLGTLITNLTHTNIVF
ncbi:MAG TPA: DUF4190 domain-containing protein [Candidatus Binatia bacterium]|nr:DUF4190 domain-containing protein [Candidatus Binatia bacterium]